MACVQFAVRAEHAWKGGMQRAHCAFAAGHEPTVKLLQQQGADLRAVDAAKRRNSLEWAAFNNHRKVCQSHTRC